jgi:uncharacterized protein (TIGR00661 family)
MARIIYGVCGEGYGHSSRAKEILAHLKKKHDVLVVGYDKSYKVLSKDFKTIEIKGLHLAYKNNKLDYWSTIISNIRKYPEFSRSFLKMNRIFKQFKPDIAFSDFEPMTALVSALNRVPLVSIDNQHLISNTKLEYPRKYRKSAFMARIAVASMIVKPSAYLVTSFFFEKIKNKKTFLFPPIIRSEVLKLKPMSKEFILVYQTSSSNKRLFDTLKKVDEKFVIYGLNTQEKDNNLQFKKHSTEEFLNDLKDCKAVILNGGFSLMTEALYLHKPVLSEPVKSQFEQIINAVYLQKMGYGKMEDFLTAEKINRFIRNIPEYRKNLERYRREGNKKIFKKIDELIRNSKKI